MLRQLLTKQIRVIFQPDNFPDLMLHVTTETSVQGQNRGDLVGRRAITETLKLGDFENTS